MFRSCITHHLMDSKECFFCKSAINSVVATDGKFIYNSVASIDKIIQQIHPPRQHTYTYWITFLVITCHSILLTFTSEVYYSYTHNLIHVVKYLFLLFVLHFLFDCFFFVRTHNILLINVKNKLCLQDKNVLLKPTKPKYLTLVQRNVQD